TLAVALLLQTARITGKFSIGEHQAKSQMATIHPSRLGLVPQDPPIYYASQGRSPSPTPPRSRSRDRDRDRDRDRNTTRERPPHEGSRRGRDDRDRPPHDHDTQRRRGSPQYEDYRRPAPPLPSVAEAQAPWRQQENLYPNRRGGEFSGGGSDFLESRRVQRENGVADPWPPSPKAPARGLSPRHKRSSRKSKRARSVSSSDSSSSEDDRRRRERKERKRARKEKDRERRREKEKRRHRRSASRSRSRPRHRSYEEEDRKKKRSSVQSHSLSQQKSGRWAPAHPKCLLRGEGSAMAAFLQDGTESRIPRRGEIGLTSDEIAQYEDVGYVMSGMRMRKENQVISAEEKRGILKLQKEERERREAILREEFGELVNGRVK
ncbi:ras-induced vulval development antagonist-domain-containing protein, partial [Infundibulicybe gibba]